jgi:hypothetical protein
MGKGLARSLSAVVSSLALVAGGVGAFAVLPAAASANSGSREIASSGTTSITDGGTLPSDPQGPELASGPEDPGSDATLSPIFPIDRSQTHGESGHANSSGESRKEDLNPEQVASFDGLNHNAQRFANGGNQFSIEPPDQGLCAGNGFVLETVNDVMAVYGSGGNRLKGPVDLNTFLGYPAAINRTTGVRGQQVTDPSCYFDGATHRWFHVALALETVASGPRGGQLTGRNHLDIAVSQTSSPLGTWTIYRIPIQDDGTEGTLDHGCSAGNPLATWRTNPHACLGDYPHIGADANGFYITTNEYSLFGPEFKAAQVYAFSKSRLAASAASVTVTQIDTTNMVRGTQPGFTVWPAESPNGRSNPPGEYDAQQALDLDTERGGTEFFLSSNAADEVNPRQDRTSTDLVVWALTNTRSLNSSTPHLTLTNTVLTAGLYAAPPPAAQKAGPTPLADCLNDITFPTPLGPGCWRLAGIPQPAHNQVEGMSIDTNDTRMQQVMFADGMVFGALDTGLVVNKSPQAGVEWFEVRPHVTAKGLNAKLVNQGYVGKAGANLSYPALAINEKGVGAMAFTLLGPNDYPSAAYVPFDAKAGAGAIHVAAAGAGPDDGFTNYKAAFGVTRTRWGDYGAAVVDGSSIWMASEYIGQTCTFEQFKTGAIGTCAGTRSALANWDTRITELAVGD